MRVVRVILMTEKKVVKKSDPNLLRDTRGTREETELGDGESQEVVVQDGDLDIAGSVENQEIGGLETDAITPYAQNHSLATTQDNGAEGHEDLDGESGEDDTTEQTCGLQDPSPAPSMLGFDASVSDPPQRPVSTTTGAMTPRGTSSSTSASRQGKSHKARQLMPTIVVSPQGPPLARNQERLESDARELQQIPRFWC
ncbi:hypothetical protein L915_12211 [Phytophthora nicotianae]|uniref:Uncharacterized protein n=2 Tax=Phytophthora nicotianae TaxID=4792 RepID=W2GH73_PHYNI|nr:hypothetical protein L915_12211 [Phytophthora nicotianae]ETO71010.1 hypothetical protein F444_12592 [Phytophthora nicotianae P1976]